MLSEHQTCLDPSDPSESDALTVRGVVQRADRGESRGCGNRMRDVGRRAGKRAIDPFESRELTVGGVVQCADRESGCADQMRDVGGGAGFSPLDPPGSRPLSLQVAAEPRPKL